MALPQASMGLVFAVKESQRGLRREVSPTKEFSRAENQKKQKKLKICKRLANLLASL
jgi:hypothetical protein